MHFQGAGAVDEPELPKVVDGEVDRRPLLEQAEELMTGIRPAAAPRDFTPRTSTPGDRFAGASAPWHYRRTVGLMDDTSKTVKPWVTFAGCVLVVVVLYWAQAVLVPFAVAILLTFVLTPPVTWLERWVGRVPAVLAVVTLVFAVLGLAGWGLARQMDHLADDLPRYRANILAKIADVRGAGKGGSVEKLQETIEDIKTDLGRSDAPKGTVPRPSSSPLSRSRVSRASRGSRRSSASWERRGSCWRWSSSCCSNAGICATG